MESGTTSRTAGLRRFESARDDQLTAGERLICRAILNGGSNADIAQARGTSIRTVANQVASILRKLRVQSRRELVALRGTHASPDDMRLLTSRESEIVELAARGASNKCIAVELGISENTVGVLLARASKKLRRPAASG